MRCPGRPGASVNVMVAVSWRGTTICNPLATAPPITKTVNTTAEMPIARPGSRCPVSTMPNSAPHTPVSTATGTAIARASPHMLIGHG